MHNDAQ
jgi:hypothetical protein